jgi:hypothetical protein
MAQGLLAERGDDGRHLDGRENVVHPLAGGGRAVKRSQAAPEARRQPEEDHGLPEAAKVKRRH